MSFNRGGRGRGGFRGGRGGRGGGRGRGSFGRREDQGPPETVVEVGEYLHSCEGDLVCKSVNEKVPYFNAPIYFENKALVGKVDEIFGQVSNHVFSVKLLPNMQAASFKQDQKLYIDPMKLLPLSRFMGNQSRSGIQKRGGGFRGRGRGGRGFTPRGRGGFTPRGRGGFTPRGRGGGGFRGRGSGGRGFRGGR